MLGNFAAEILKIRKRPAYWVLGLLFSGVIFANYLSTYNYFSAQDNAGSLGVDPELVVRSLLPQNVLGNVIIITSTFGGAVALFFGATAVGSEYGWETNRLLLTQGPSRFGSYVGKALAMGVALIVLSVLALFAGALGSYIVAALENAPVSWPPLLETMRSLGSIWITLAAWTAFGSFLATLFRGTAPAIGLGLVYAFILEGMISSLPSKSGLLGGIGGVLLSGASTGLARSFKGTTQSLLTPGSMTEPTGYALTLALYAAGATVLAAFILARRDVV